MKGSAILHTRAEPHIDLAHLCSADKLCRGAFEPETDKAATAQHQFGVVQNITDCSGDILGLGITRRIADNRDADAVKCTAARSVRRIRDVFLAQAHVERRHIASRCGIKNRIPHQCSQRAILGQYCKNRALQWA